MNNLGFDKLLNFQLAVLFPCSPLFSLLALRVLTLRCSHNVGVDYWADASASSLVVSSLESPFDFSGFPHHSADNRWSSLAYPIPFAVFSIPPRENFLNSRRLLAGTLGGSAFTDRHARPEPGIRTRRTVPHSLPAAGFSPATDQRSCVPPASTSGRNRRLDRAFHSPTQHIRFRTHPVGS
jgi:hypothetical protein